MRGCYKRRPFTGFTALLLVLVITANGCTEVSSRAPLPDKVELYYFYDETATDGDTDDIYSLFEEKVSAHKDLYPYEIFPHDVSSPEGQEEYKRLMSERGLDKDNIDFPALVVGGKIYSPAVMVEDNILEAFLTAGEDIFVNEYVYYPSHYAGGSLFERYKAEPEHITAVYFYRTTCDECNTTKPVIDSLPGLITIQGTETHLDVIRINTRSGNNGELARAFFDEYKVPEDKQMVPIVFLTDVFFAGYEEISSGLAENIASGNGLGFKFPNK